MRQTLVTAPCFGGTNIHTPTTLLNFAARTFDGFKINIANFDFYKFIGANKQVIHLTAQLLDYISCQSGQFPLSTLRCQHLSNLEFLRCYYGL